MKVLIINGPNLNMLGHREPSIYGTETFEDILRDLQLRFPLFTFDFYQSNHEGALIDKIHTYRFYDAIVINPGALTHYSYALYDALRIANIPIIEVHLSNVHKREPFRNQSVVSPACLGVITGFGKWSYVLALDYLEEYFNNITRTSEVNENTDIPKVR